MLPNPLHPAVVHFPIVLMFVLPITAAVALWTIRWGAKPRRAWLAPLTVAVALTGSAWMAIQTGEAQEDRVEQVVPESALATHEQAADRFLLLSLAVTGLLAAGLLTGRVGAGLRGVGVMAAVLLVVAGYQVGHSGAALVYRYGAAATYTAEGTASTVPGIPKRGEHARGEGRDPDRQTEDGRQGTS